MLGVYEFFLESLCVLELSGVLPLQGFVLDPQLLKLLAQVAVFRLADLLPGGGLVPSLQLAKLPQQIVVLLLQTLPLAPLVLDELVVLPLQLPKLLHLRDGQVVEGLLLSEQHLVELVLSLLSPSLLCIPQLYAVLAL